MKPLDPKEEGVPAKAPKPLPGFGPFPNAPTPKAVAGFEESVCEVAAKALDPNAVLVCIPNPPAEGVVEALPKPKPVLGWLDPKAVEPNAGLAPKPDVA